MNDGRNLINNDASHTGRVYHRKLEDIGESTCIDARKHTMKDNGIPVVGPLRINIFGSLLISSVVSFNMNRACFSVNLPSWTKWSFTSSTLGLNPP